MALVKFIEDDGTGIPGDGTAPISRGIGVIGMRERAQSLSGTFAIGRAERGGTRVSVAIPLTPRARDLQDTVATATI
jgi:signal transduction histidine kinase